MPASRALYLPDLGFVEPSPPARQSRQTMGASSAADLFTQPLMPMLTAVAVAALVLLAILTARSADLIVALWAANAFAVAVWLRSGRGLSFDLSFGALMAMGILVGEFLAGNSPALSLMFTVANMIEIVAAVALARRFAPTLNLSSVEGACRFMLAAALIAPMPAALFASISLAVLRDAPFLMGFQTWWFGHVLGLAIITPMLLAVDRRSLLILNRPWKLLEWGVLLGLLCGVAWFAYFRSTVPLAFLVTPILVVVAVRLRIPGITAAMLMVTMYAVAAALLRDPALTSAPLAERVMLIQLNMLFAYLPFLLVASLLDERDQLSQRARAGQRRAEQASESKSRLLANVAHEIKSPVGGVIGIGEMWTAGHLGPITATQKEMADMLVKTARQVETLAHDLLDVARAESGAVKVELRPTDVPGVIEDVRRTTAIRPEAQGLRLDVVYEGEGLIALADSQRLTQVIDNLATNAVKYGAAGGSVTFRVRSIPDGVRIEIVDRGPGLSLQKQAQLFEPFNRLGLERSAIEGHGIGLALAKRLVELQHGAIGVDSAPGEGATFWVELPAA